MVLPGSNRRTNGEFIVDAEGRQTSSHPMYVAFKKGFSAGDVDRRPAFAVEMKL